MIIVISRNIPIFFPKIRRTSPVSIRFCCPVDFDDPPLDQLLVICPVGLPGVMWFPETSRKKTKLQDPHGSPNLDGKDMVPVEFSFMGSTAAISKRPLIFMTDR